MARYTRRRTARRSSARRTAKNYSLHKVITGGSYNLDADTQTRVVDVLATAEGNDWYGKDLATRGNSIVSLRGNFWVWSDAPADAVQTLNYMSVGFIAENTDMRAAVDPGALSTVGPIDLEGRYRPWHYRRTVPIMPRAVQSGGQYDQAHQLTNNRYGIGVRRAEKFMSVRDQYSMYIQSNADYQVGFAWQLQLYVREP